MKEISTELYFLDILLGWAGNVFDITYMPQKNQSTGGVKRSKHDYYNNFTNETIIKLLYEE